MLLSSFHSSVPNGAHDLVDLAATFHRIGEVFQTEAQITERRLIRQAALERDPAVQMARTTKCALVERRRGVQPTVKLALAKLREDIQPVTTAT